MEVTNPRRILAVSHQASAVHLARVIKDLTGSNPVPASTSLAGTSHDLPLKTPYYTATVPTWLDLIASPEEWAESFLSEEARQVLAVLGGIILVFCIPNARPGDLTHDEDDGVPSLIRHVGRVVQKGLGGWEWDGVRLAVGVGEGEPEEWDELCAEAGFEFVQVGGARKEVNEFGEKTGIPRVREALESNDWAQLDDEHGNEEGEEEGEDEISGGSEFGDFKGGSDKDKHGTELDVEKLGFGFDRADFEGLRKAIWESGQDASVDDEGEDKEGGGGKDADGKGEAGDADLNEEEVAKVERMMRKLQAAREMGEGMSEAQRRRLAARAVEEVMQHL